MQVRDPITSPAPAAAHDDARRGRIVVGVDGSDASIRALRWAMEAAQQSGATLRAVIASGPPDLYGTVTGVEQRAHALLDEAVRKAVDGADVDVVGIVREGHPVPALVAESRGARLLVLGCRGAGGFLGMRVGSVSTHLVGHAPCPMVLVPEESDDAAPEIAAPA